MISPTELPTMPRTKVLIIDDEPDLCLLLKAYFSQKKDWEVHISHSLETGFKDLDSLLPDLLFLDNNLPDGTGWKHAPELAKKYPEMEIAMISAFHPHRPEMPLHSRYVILEKPISFSDLDQQLQVLQNA